MAFLWLRNVGDPNPLTSPGMILQVQIWFVKFHFLGGVSSSFRHYSREKDLRKWKSLGKMLFCPHFLEQTPLKKLDSLDKHDFWLEFREASRHCGNSRH